MNSRISILVLGGGGREHALCWKIAQSDRLDTLYCSPGNAGIAQVAECVALESTQNIIEFCRDKRIGLVVIGPEQYLVDGVTNALRAENIPVCGPSKAASVLESSKAYTKQLCIEYGIPTAAYAVFTDLAAALSYLPTQSFPLVLKADGLAAGKGVLIAQNMEQAQQGLRELFSGALGAAGETVVIEEFLVGPELSVFALCDGKDCIELGGARDHKRAYDHDQGPNTGGMGTFSPVREMTPALSQQLRETVFLPTLRAMKARGISFQGVLFAGLILTAQGPKLLEYNVRFGDPETQVLMARLKSDLVPLLLACANGNLAGMRAEFHDRAAVCVVMASKGYPANYEKGTPMTLPANGDHSIIFHAGTALKNGQLCATGGRVLGVTAWGDDMPQARTRAYDLVDHVIWPNGFCRRDIVGNS